MAIRAILTTLYLDGNHVRNPVVDYIDTFSNIDLPTKILYPDPIGAGDGRPNKSICIVLVKSKTFTGTQIETQAKNISGAAVIPAIKPGTLISSLSTEQRSAYVRALNNHNIPLTALDGAVTVGQAFKNILDHISPGFGQKVADEYHSLGDDFS